MSFAYVSLTYVLACVVAWWTFDASGGGWAAASLAGLMASTAVTIVASLAVNNGSVFDPWWSVLPPVAALWLAVRAPVLDLRTILVLVVVGLWAIRLTLNWARGWPGLHHEDWRYEKLYREWPLPRWLTLVLGVEVVPTLIVWLGCLPLGAALSGGGGAMGVVDAVAFGVGLMATTLELVADEQMRRFARTKASGDLMQGGLWRLSRHPNYFGEMLFWSSLLIFGLAADPGAWWAGAGVVAMLGMFIFASIPMLDERSRARRPDFEAYARRTSALVPWPPRSGDREPAGR